MFRKALFTYLTIRANSSADAEYVTDILEGHNRRASESSISSDTVMVHMRLINDGQDLTEMLNSLEQQFPAGVSITANPPYIARMSTESKQKLKSFIVPAFGGYFATIIGIVMINWQSLTWNLVPEALITSLFPAAAAIFLKIYEEYK